MSLLFSPLSLRTITLKNRIALSPMCQYQSTDGHPGNWQLMHLGSRAAGGAGLVMTEATSVAPEGRISPWDAGLWNDSQIESWKTIFAFIKSFGAVPGVQLAHAGRKASADYPWKGGRSLSLDQGGWETISPTATAFGAHLDKVPHAMSSGEITKLIEDFGASAKRALKAGAELVEIHAGHGYLLHEFLSPITNHRTDEYGGSYENRIRILIQCVQSVRQNWPEELPLLVRLSTTDWSADGWQLSESVELAKLLKDLKVDLIDSSSGFVAPSPTLYPIGPNWQVELSATIRREAQILTGAVGMISKGVQAEEILQNEQADLVFIGREFLRQPYWPIIAAKELGIDVTTVGNSSISHWVK